MLQLYVHDHLLQLQNVVYLLYNLHAYICILHLIVYANFIMTNKFSFLYEAVV